MHATSSMVVCVGNRPGVSNSSCHTLKGAHCSDCLLIAQASSQTSPDFHVLALWGGAAKSCQATQSTRSSLTLTCVLGIALYHLHSQINCIFKHTYHVNYNERNFRTAPSLCPMVVNRAPMHLAYNVNANAGDASPAIRASCYKSLVLCEGMYAGSSNPWVHCNGRDIWGKEG